jgi:hypothetical protein
MKYVEELSSGDFFQYKNHKFILSSDFKKNKTDFSHRAISIEDGSTIWLDSTEIVDIIDLYHRDKEGNILLVKEYKNEFAENKNIS